MYDVAIIGAGVVGTFVARELCRYKLKVIILEKDNDVANGTTKANSAIAHAGYDAKPNSMKAKFNVQGNLMLDEVCSELDVPLKRIGTIVVAFCQEEMVTIKEIYERGTINKVPRLKILDRNELKAMEPNISDEAIGALYAPTGGILGPFELAMALAENAVENGTELSLNSEVIKINKIENGYKIYTKDKEIEAKYVVNCAGVYADKIHNMVSSPAFEITPRRGQYYILDKSAGSIVNTVVFQCPSKLGKGIVVSPTVHGNLLIGPDAEDLRDKENTETTDERLAYVKETAKKSCDKIPFNASITSFAGLRATPNTGDFIIKEVEDAKGFIDVAGIESPGLTASPAIGKYVVNLLKDIDGNFQVNDKYNPIRRKMVRFMELNQEEKNEVIKKDSRYGRIICRCENITEGEIIDAIHRKSGAKTVDGVKRRVRPGMGRCQGGFCEPRVIEILARELGMNITQIVKDSPDSNIAIAETKSNSKA